MSAGITSDGSAGRSRIQAIVGDWVREQPKVGVKHDDEKPRMALLSTYALTETAKVLNYGAEKYGADNWRAGISARRLISAALRHILAFNDGEDNDPETGLSHLAHAMCMIMFELESHVTHPELDDRYKSVQSVVVPIDPDFFPSESSTYRWCG